MQDFSRWEDEEVKTLFRFVEVKKSEGVPLIQIFSLYANATKRQKNSVRNYYYKELAFLQNDKERQQLLQINLDNHIVTKGVPFSKDEEENALNNINELIANGYSVRKACLELAGGNVAKMIRLQNKYRSKMKEKGSWDGMGKIIKMPENKPGLKEEDIKALFMGLVKLVKRQEFENAKQLVAGELFDANEKLKRAIAEIAIREQKISELQKQIELAKNEKIINEEEKIKTRVNSLKKKKTATSIVKEYFEKNKKPEFVAGREDN